MRVYLLSSHSLIFRTHSSSRYSVAALVGTLELDHRLVDLDIQAPLDLSLKSIQKAVERGPTIIAQSVMSTQIKRVYGEVREIRAKFGNKVIIIGGGAHASIRPKELLTNGFHYVVVGEGEYAFPELVWYLMNDKDPSDISGVIDKTTEEIPVPKKLPIVNLDEYPPFALEKNILGPIEVTRGCPFQCKFCSTPFLTGGRVRHRSVESITRWLKLAVEKSGFERTWFLSPNALCYGGNGRKSEAKKIEELLKAVTKVDGLNEVFFGSFPSEVRPEFVTSTILEMIRSYVANDTIQIGLQSSSNRVLELANRHHTVEQGMDAIRAALDTGFIPHVDMIFGMPGETKEELHDSVEMCYNLVEMGAKTHGHVFMPLPGSVYENMPPGKLDSESRRLLGELSRRKDMTGSWSTQEDLAENLWFQNKSSTDRT
ncbi:MAG: TIGR04013 family B12-binding domain/radical SAM domain-containing protein [Candidatus Thorarchaeota archaeon]|nr:MAG: TIGR04013 family B12-binding domain/radical SAM domain-containing protein [Candidatus Thorarchaeota archaeon]